MICVFNPFQSFFLVFKFSHWKLGAPPCCLCVLLTWPQRSWITSLLSGIKCLKFILYDSHPSLGLANFSKELLELEFEPRQYNYRTQALNCEPKHLITPQTWEPWRSNTWPFFPSLAPPILRFSHSSSHLWISPSAILGLPWQDRQHSSTQMIPGHWKSGLLSDSLRILTVSSPCDRIIRFGCCYDFCPFVGHFWFGRDSYFII